MAHAKKDYRSTRFIFLRHGGVITCDPMNETLNQKFKIPLNSGELQHSDH